MPFDIPKNLLHPRHWLSWLAAGILFAIVKIVPYRWLMAFGQGLGKVMEKLMPYRFLIAKTNIKLCFSNNHWEDIYQKHVGSLGKGVFEMAMGWFLDLSNFHSRVEHRGDDVVKAALAEGRGVLFLGIHTTNLDFCAPLLAHKYPVSPMYQKAKNSVLDYLITRSRLRHCPTVIERKNMRELLLRLKQGECVWYGCDQDFGMNGQSVFASFFNVQTYTLASYAKLAQKTGAAVIPVAGLRNDKIGTYILRYLPEIKVDNITEYDAARAMNEAIEQLIEGYEEQYYWVHRRFKTRPEGEAALYPPKPSQLRREKKRNP